MPRLGYGMGMGRCHPGEPGGGGGDIGGGPVQLLAPTAIAVTSPGTGILALGFTLPGVVPFGIQYQIDRNGSSFMSGLYLVGNDLPFNFLNDSGLYNAVYDITIYNSAEGDPAYINSENAGVSNFWVGPLDSPTGLTITRIDGGVNIQWTDPTYCPNGVHLLVTVNTSPVEDNDYLTTEHASGIDVLGGEGNYAVSIVALGNGDLIENSSAASRSFTKLPAPSISSVSDNFDGSLTVNWSGATPCPFGYHIEATQPSSASNDVDSSTNSQQFSLGTGDYQGFLFNRDNNDPSYLESDHTTWAGTATS